jgi:hypothetical protein
LPSPDPVSRGHLEVIAAEVTDRAVELLTEAGRAEGMRPATVRRAVRATVMAAAELQQQGREPTDRALHEHGAPGPDSIRRLFTLVDLAELPATQSRIAIDAGLVPPPECIVVEAHTETTKGPEKCGTVHPHPPRGLPGVPAAPGVPHVTGGIASAMAFGEADGTVMPFGDIPLHQGYYDPSIYGTRTQAVEQLRLRTQMLGSPFICGPQDVAEEMVRRIGMVERLKRWEVEFDGRVVCGGRLRMGYPLPGAFGAGRDERYLGCHLAVLLHLAQAGMVPFFGLPTGLRDGRQPGVTLERCDWLFAVGAEQLPLDAVLELLHDPEAAWATAAPSELAAEGLIGPQVRWLHTTATTPPGCSLEITLVAVLDWHGALDLFVTTLPMRGREDLRALARIVSAEHARRLPSSPLGRSVHSLLTDGHAQRHQRRNHPERRGFGAVAQTALGLIELGRRAA